MSISRIALHIIWPPVAALLVGLALWTFLVKPELLARPAIAVLDVPAAIASEAGTDQSATGLAKATATVQNRAITLREHGYIVLRSRDVYAYPPQFAVPEK